jgi:putative endonuclease
MHYFYILRCSDNSLYSGKTSNLKRRVEEHNSSRLKSAKYTKSRRPVTLVYSEKFSTLSDALKREWEVKTWKKVRKEALIRDSKI